MIPLPLAPGEDGEIEAAVHKLLGALVRFPIVRSVNGTVDPDGLPMEAGEEEERCRTYLTIYGLTRRRRNQATVGVAGVSWLYGEELGDLAEEEEAEKREAEEEEEAMLVKVRRLLAERVPSVGSLILPLDNIQLLPSRKSKSAPCPCCGKSCDDCSP